MTSPLTYSPATYVRETYVMRRFEVVAPHVRNDGAPSGYPEALAAALAAEGFTGWTEVPTVGYWHGAREAGTTFVLYAPVDTDPSETLARIARASMPDQVAVQVVSDGSLYTLQEA